MDRPGKVASPARGQLDRENGISVSPFAPENRRDGFGSTHSGYSITHNPVYYV